MAAYQETNVTLFYSLFALYGFKVELEVDVKIILLLMIVFLLEFMKGKNLEIG
jgi:hypothetical protein